MKFDLFLLPVLVISLILSIIKIPSLQSLIPIVNFIALAPVIFSAFKALKRREITVDLLAVVALTFSFLTKEWNSALFINLMLTSARVFSAWTQKRTENAIKSLLKYKPASIKIKNGKDFIFKKPEEIEVGDIMIVSAGERIATDGTIVNGSSAIDESTLTGESVPRSVTLGDMVYSSSLNTAGVLEIKAIRVEKESALAKIILSVEKATLKKSKTIRTSSLFASWYIVATLVGSVLIYLITKSTNFTLSVLLVVCADDLAVSIPLAFTLGIAQATRRGILVKSSDVIEKLRNLRFLITDKTGTLTKAKIKIKEVINLSDMDNSRLFSLLATIEMNSKHPVSIEIFNYTKFKEADIKTPVAYKESPGDGAEMKVDGDKFYVGKLSFIKEKGVSITKKDENLIKNLTDSGYSLSYFGVDKKLLAIVVFEDEIKPNIKNVVMETKRMGVTRWIMLTGDANLIAKKIAFESGIDEYKSGLSPEQKMEYIKHLKSESKGMVGMVGDGVNDAPALSLSDISISMGSIGSDTAIEASDISIMNDDLGKIPEVMKLSQKVNNLVNENMILWGATNIIGLGLVLGGLLGPTGAATYNFLTDFITTFNVLRLLKK